jgi:hypothetical protein
MKVARTARIAGIVFTLPLVIMAAAAIIYFIYFWQHLGLGPKDMSEYNESQKDIQQFFSAREKLENARNAIESDNPNLASTHLQLIHQYFLDIKNIPGFNTADSQKFVQSLDKLKQVTNDIISLPEGVELLAVLERKLKAFNEFAIQNRWQIMNKTSQRNIERINILVNKRTNIMRPNSLSKVASDLSRDIDFMLSVIAKSKLKDFEKSQIESRLDALRPEIKMLNDLASIVAQYYSTHTTILDSFSVLSNQVEQMRNGRDLIVHQFTRWMIIGFYGLMALPVLLLFTLPFVLKVVGRASNQEKESYFLDTFKKQVLGNDEINGDDLFSQELVKVKTYIQKRMSFGSIFQDSLPFPSMLLDSNLKVMWANEHFFEAWDSLEVKASDDSFTWDYLQKFTNFDSPSPLLQAAQEGLAGIYQIQIKNKAQGVMVPYEMYVSPVQYQGQTRVMIIFYPLSALQETIAEQSRSILGPVNKVLDAWTSQQFGPEFRGQIAQDFEQAEIRPLFEKMCFYEQMQTQQKESLLSQIEENENRLFDLLRAVNDVMESQHIQEDIANDMSPVFKNLKDQIIEYVDLRSKAERFFNEQTIRAREILQAAQYNEDSVEKYQHAIGQINNSFEGLKTIKNNFQESKHAIDKYRTRVIQNIEQVIVASKKYAPELQEMLTKLRTEIKEIDKTMIELHHNSTNFDVYESKQSMMKAPLENLRNRQKPTTISADELDSSAFQFGRLMAKFDELDHKTVDSLKAFFQCVNNLKATNRDIGRTLTNELGNESDLNSNFNENPENDQQTQTNA